MATRAGAVGATTINWVVTHFFIDADGDDVPESYCYKPDSDSEECVPFSDSVIEQWSKGLAECMRPAVEAGFDIAYTPHLDDGRGNSAWRNAMRINPLEK